MATESEVKKRLGSIFLTLPLVIVLGLIVGSVLFSGCERKKDRELAYHNAEVRLRSYIEGGTIAYRSVDGTSRHRARLLAQDKYPPEDIPEAERARIEDAIEKLQTRDISETPILVLARLAWIQRNGSCWLHLEYLTSDDNVVGFIVSERWPDGTQIEERYPAFLWPSWRKIYQGEVHQIFNIHNYVDDPQDRGPVIRTKEQKKNEGEWNRWLEMVELGGNQSEDINVPFFWISVPHQREVYISVYDKDGNVSEEVPLRFMAYPSASAEEFIEFLEEIHGKKPQYDHDLEDRRTAPHHTVDDELIGPRTFNSELPLLVKAYKIDWERFEKEEIYTGNTPAEAPLQIPECTYWTVESDGTPSWGEVIEEVRKHDIPGITMVGVDDSDLMRLAGLRNLRHLHIHLSYDVTDAGLERLQNLENLQWLVLSSTRVSDAGVERLLGLESLLYIALDRTRITDAGLEHLKELENLRGIDLAENHSGISDTGLKHLRGLTNLRALNLQRTRVTDGGLVHLSNMENLRHLSLHHTVITDNGLERLRGLTNMRVLNLRRTRVTDDGLVHLSDMENLQRLVLTHTRISDAGLAHLAGLENLRVLSFHDTAVTDEGVQKLKEALPNLEVSGP